MSESAALQKISDDLAFLKEKVISIEADLEEISMDIHRDVRPEYIEKLKKIDSGIFLSEDDFEKELSKE